MRSYVVVSGVPGSGKSTVARVLAEELGWPLLDKDDYLEALFREKGYADSDERQVLSREADVLFQRAAAVKDRAVLDSFWRPPASESTSGTPTDWLVSSDTRVLEVVCQCPAEIAALRFLGRERHPGHRDDCWTRQSLMAQSRRLEQDLPLGLGEVVDYDSSGPPNLEPLVSAVRAWAAA